MMSGELITQVNRSLGFAAVGRIRLRQDLIRPNSGPSGGQPASQEKPMPGAEGLSLHTLEEATSRIQSPEVRAALIRLGRTIKG